MTTQNGCAAGALGAAGPERARFLPKRGDAAFDRSEVERFVHHGILVRAMPAGAALKIGWRPSERRRQLHAPKAQAPRGL